MPRVSYLICCHNETETLNNLLQFIIKNRNPDDEIIILNDFSDNPSGNSLISSVNGIKAGLISSNVYFIFLFKHSSNKPT